MAAFTYDKAYWRGKFAQMVSFLKGTAAYVPPGSDVAASKRDDLLADAAAAYKEKSVNVTRYRQAVGTAALARDVRYARARRVWLLAQGMAGGLRETYDIHETLAEHRKP